LTVMGVTDTDSSIFPGIPLSDATAFKYHVPETYRRHLSIGFGQPSMDAPFLVCSPRVYFHLEHSLFPCPSKSYAAITRLNRVPGKREGCWTSPPTPAPLNPGLSGPDTLYSV
jgi:hypothetical protein